MSVAKKIAESSRRSSWIRQMFEEGASSAEIHGCDNVFDFSIGNPNLEPPEEFQRVMEELVARSDSRTARLHVQRRLPGDAGGGGRLPVARTRACDLTGATRGHDRAAPAAPST